jgi:lysophospholipase L1-like esterase
VRLALATALACATLGALAATSLGGGASASSAAPTPRTLLDVGDSLSVGTDPYLRRELRGYRIDRLYDVGLHADDAATIVERARRSLPSVLVVSAGTNDDPRLVSEFWRSVSQIVDVAGKDRCVVWPTIARPPAAGTSYGAMNRALARLAARYASLELVDWHKLVRRHPSWLARDGVHVSVAGYRARAAAIAAAVKTRCPS